MTIKSIEEKPHKIEIDLSGPNGNVFYLIGVAKNLARTLNKRRGAPYFDPDELSKEMMSGDYDHAVEVFDKNFGHIVTMYR